jgi:hypothetical protein
MDLTNNYRRAVFVLDFLKQGRRNPCFYFFDRKAKKRLQKKGKYGYSFNKISIESVKIFRAKNPEAV